MAEQIPSAALPSLSFKNLYKHFFLIHDFFHKITKTKAPNADYFDLQLDIYDGMKTAVKRGSNISQAVSFTGIVTYYLRGNSIRLRFILGFFFLYWYNHIMTLGSYAGAFAYLPFVYKKTAIYYQKHPEEKNLITGLNKLMQSGETFEQPQIVLCQLFGQQQQEKSFVANDFYVKNKEKYIPKEVLDPHFYDKKLAYFDSFLTRYVYYSFTRWWSRLGQFIFSDNGSQSD